MINVPIKFRGKHFVTGEYVYGGFYRFDVFNLDYIVQNAQFIRVKDASQLVGYDVDGKEIYEGDFLTNQKGSDFQAALKGLVINVDNPCYSRYLDVPKYKKYYRFKCN